MTSHLEARLYEYPDRLVVPESGPLSSEHLRFAYRVDSQIEPALKRYAVEPFENALKARARSRALDEHGEDENGVVRESHVERFEFGTYRLDVHVTRKRSSTSWKAGLEGLSPILEYLSSSSAAGVQHAEAKRYRGITFMRVEDVIREANRLKEPGPPGESPAVFWKDADGNKQSLDETIKSVLVVPDPSYASRLTNANAQTAFAAKSLIERLNGFKKHVHAYAQAYYIDESALHAVKRRSQPVIVPIEAEWYAKITKSTSANPKWKQAFERLVPISGAKESVRPDLSVLASTSLDDSYEENGLSVVANRMRTPGHGLISIERPDAKIEYRVIEDGSMFVSEVSLGRAIERVKRLTSGSKETFKVEFEPL